MAKVRYLEVNKPNKGRRFAIGDIHGCSKTFKAVLKQINLNHDDQLFIMGDMINRGPKSDKVLDRIIKLRGKGFQVFILKGNHEDMVLKANKQGQESLMRLLSIYKSECLAINGQLNPVYEDLLDHAYHYFILDDFYLVHAGFDFSKPNPFEDTRSMMYIKDFKPNKIKLNDKRVVLGHSPRSIGEIIHRLKSDRRKIHIDNGCINHKTIGQGNLICLNLDTLGITLQQNLDKKNPAK